MLTEEARVRVNEALGEARKAFANILFVEDFCKSHSLGKNVCELLKREKRTARYFLRKASEESNEALVASSKEDSDPWYIMRERLSEKEENLIKASNKRERQMYLDELLEEGQRKVENSQISPTGLWYLSRNWLVRFSDGWYYYCKYEMDC